MLSSGQHLDPHRPPWTRWSSPSVSGEVQISCQVRTNCPPLPSNINALPDRRVVLMSRSLFFRAIVFVVDSAIFQKEVRDVAEFLYVLLTDTVICRNAPALIVACNKQGERTSLLGNRPATHLFCVQLCLLVLCFTDITMAKSAKLIQQQLEKEL